VRTSSARHPRSTTGRPGWPRRWQAVVATAVACGLALAACGSPAATKDPSKSKPTEPSKSKSKSQSNPTTTSGTTTTTAPQVTSPTMVLGGKTVTVPTDDGSPITPLQDSGQNAVLTTKGFLPRVLYASRTTPVVYTNLTPRPVTITFPHSPASPPALIPPGGSYDYTPRSLQFQYTSSTGFTAYVVVGAFTG
jgi:uncharacterized membrane protein